MASVPLLPGFVASEFYVSAVEMNLPVLRPPMAVGGKITRSARPSNCWECECFTNLDRGVLIDNGNTRETNSLDYFHIDSWAKCGSMNGEMRGG